MTLKYHDLREFIAWLEQHGELKRVRQAIDPRLEMTEVCDRVLARQGPALLFEQPTGHTMPVLGNLFGTVRRVALAMGVDASPDEAVKELRRIGELLAFLKEPEPPTGWRDALEKFPKFKQVLNMAPKVVHSAPCQEVTWEAADVDLGRLPIQTCWPEDAGPLITWGLVITRGPHKTRENLGIYRQQVLGPNRVILRWLAHRGGALDYREHCALHPREPFPVSVVLGRRSGHHPRCGDTDSRYAVGVSIRRAAAWCAHRAGEIDRFVVACAGKRGDRAGRLDQAERFGARGTVR